ncbi:oxidoreductase [Fonsecaea pedrosoi]|nr:oxidoreductase [Fonsecaea pedrosoi]
MPSVLLTGANGFLATHVLKCLVEDAFDVVGTVRSEAKADDVFDAHPEFKSRLRLAVVSDISAPGAYDKVFERGHFDYIIHTAAPVPDGDGTDFDRDFLGPGAQGNLELLHAAQKYCKSLKHFTYTGSMVAVHDVTKPLDGRVLKSTDWNPVSPEVARQLQHPGASYMISKTLAEKALWDFVKKEKPAFGVSVLSVPLIIGPPLQHLHQNATGKSRFNMSADLFYQTFLKPVSGTVDGSSRPLYIGYIDVRDAAALHVQSIIKGGSENRRLLVASPEPFLAKTVLGILADKFPQLVNRLPSVRAAAIVANGEQDEHHPLKVDDSEAKQLFGGRIYRPLEQTVVDTAKRLLELE